MTKYSFHGGHSGQFCVHAKGKLEDFIISYINKNFKTVGISEHMPAVNDELMYPDEKQNGYTAQKLHKKFKGYVFEFNRLKKKYSNKINLFLGMETEWLTDSPSVIQNLKNKYNFDYIVGSVHHVANMPIDFSPELFLSSASAFGGINELYEAYFDEQYDMIQELKPEIIGHFDLIRKFDKQYSTRINNPKILKKINRNLKLIKELDLTIDLNFRPIYAMGVKEPYPCKSILEKISEMQIKCVFGDDSHSPEEAGNCFDEFIDIINKYKLNHNEKFDFIKVKHEI
jgi:histidinol-phosphatase (PHP family)